MRAGISGLGTAVPAQRLTNADLEARVDTSDDWIVERTGIRERRIAAVGRDHRDARDRGRHAAIKHAGIPPDAIDLLIVATATPEQPIPHTGAFVGEGLGLRCGSFDLEAGCAGFVYVLVVGSSLLTAGGLDHVLLIGSETLSRIVDPAGPRHVHPLRRRRGRRRAQPRGRRAAPASSAGTSAATGRRPVCSASRAGGSRMPATPDTIAAGEHYLKMQGQEVFRRAVRVVVDSAFTTLERAGVDAADVDWFVPHQANLRIIESAANRLGIPPEKTIVNIDRFGNTSAASIPLALAEAHEDGRLRPATSSSCPASAPA